MEKNKFISQRTHTRVTFQPLRTSCRLVCLTPMSPMTQSIVVTNGAPVYDPNRMLTPTKILPEVRVTDPDQILKNGSANEYLGAIKWYIDGETISNVWNVGTDFDIDIEENSKTRGMLTIKKNIPATEKHTIWFRGQFLDTRTGLTYTVESNKETLFTTDKGSDSVSCSIDKSSVMYDPLRDGLLLYEYKKARGIPVSGTRDSYINEKCYEQKVTVILTNGVTKLNALPEGVSMQVFANGTNTPIQANSLDHPEITSIAYPYIHLDMRLIDIMNYEVRFIQDGTVQARAYFSAHTELSMPEKGQPLRGSDLSAGQTMYTNTVLLSRKDTVIQCPELYYLIRWFTQARQLVDGVWKNAPVKEWQHGQNVSVEVRDLGIGVTVNDSYFDLFFEVHPHDVASLLMADDTTIFTDDEGNDLIG